MFARVNAMPPPSTVYLFTLLSTLSPPAPPQAVQFQGSDGFHHEFVFDQVGHIIISSRMVTRGWPKASLASIASTSAHTVCVTVYVCVWPGLW